MRNFSAANVRFKREKASYPGRAKKDAFHARCTVTMTTPTGYASAIVNIVAAISCFVLSSARCLFCCKRSNTFCRHCCPVMGKNFCDWKSEVTCLKEFFCRPFWPLRPSARHWHWIRRLQLEAQTLEIVFPFSHCPPGQWQQDLWNPGLVFLFLLHFSCLSSFFWRLQHFRNFLYSLPMLFQCLGHFFSDPLCHCISFLSADREYLSVLK